MESYRQACNRIIGTNKTKSKTVSSMEKERLSFKDIRNITKSMIGNRKAHQENPGVLTNIKGKMYCLRLGEVGKQR